MEFYLNKVIYKYYKRPPGLVRTWKPSVVHFCAPERAPGLRYYAALRSVLVAVPGLSRVTTRGSRCIPAGPLAAPWQWFAGLLARGDLTDGRRGAESSLSMWGPGDPTSEHRPESAMTRSITTTSRRRHGDGQSGPPELQVAATATLAFNHLTCRGCPGVHNWWAVRPVTDSPMLLMGLEPSRSCGGELVGACKRMFQCVFLHRECAWERQDQMSKHLRLRSPVLLLSLQKTEMTGSREMAPKAFMLWWRIFCLRYWSFTEMGFKKFYAQKIPWQVVGPSIKRNNLTCAAFNKILQSYYRFEVTRTRRKGFQE